MARLGLAQLVSARFFGRYRRPEAKMIAFREDKTRSIF
jgi:hypothetical protein